MKTKIERYPMKKFVTLAALGLSLSLAGTAVAAPMALRDRVRAVPSGADSAGENVGA